MTFCIITHVPHSEKDNSFFAYSPYVNEMNIWSKYADKVIVVAPKEQFDINPIHAAYNYTDINFVTVNKFNTLSLLSILKSLFSIPVNCWRIFRAMGKADHIHLRCPGNMGLLGCFVQVFFPKKTKTAKYAGNWDPNAKQPFSYKLQKWMLSNTFLTKNMQVLVYGRWENQSKNVRPFFTATYSESEKSEVAPRSLKGKIYFIFAGGLTTGKQPLYAAQLVEKLKNDGHDIAFSFYGDGIEKAKLQQYISENALQETILIKGNADKETIKKAYQQSHFLILPSKSEGWPKVVAEAMFWGCLPVVTPVSCVPFMLDHGNRGVMLTNDLNQDRIQVQELMRNNEDYNSKVNDAITWSRQYTIDIFESEIQKMMRA